MLGRLDVCGAGHVMENRTRPRPAEGSRETPGVPARRAALRMLDAVLRRGLALEVALSPATGDVPNPSDRALARALASAALRSLPDLDALIDSATPRPLPPDSKARFVLRVALAGWLRLGTPPHAAVATALPLVEGGPRRLVHGVLGALTRRGVTLPDVATLPAPVAERWRRAWGDDVVVAAGRLLAGQPPLDLALRDPAETAVWVERLEGMSLAPGHVRISPASDVSALPGYDAGAWWVQDVAASLPHRLLGLGEGRTVLDLCAAPGGKALGLAAAGWRVQALDASASRLGRLRENAARTGLAVDIVEADIFAWQPDAPVDAVLLDAPCSSTGVFRRHPEVLHRATSRQIAEQAALQARMLARAADWVRPGGTLVYATCSLEREEGEAIVDAFLAAHGGFALDPVAPDELPAGLAPDPQGRVRVLPGMLEAHGGADGFFVARLRNSRG